MERDQALELLRAHHAFPGPFTFRLVVREEVVTTVSARFAELGEVVAVEVVPSRGRRFHAVRATVWMDDAERVIDAWAVFASLDGVLTSM